MWIHCFHHQALQPSSSIWFNPSLDAWQHAWLPLHTSSSRWSFLWSLSVRCYVKASCIFSSSVGLLLQAHILWNHPVPMLRVWVKCLQHMIGYIGLLWKDSIRRCTAFVHISFTDLGSQRSCIQNVHHDDQRILLSAAFPSCSSTHQRVQHLLHTLDLH